MKILEEFDLDRSTRPKAFRSLTLCGEITLYHEMRRVRHPQAIYNSSLHKIAKRMIAVIEALNELRNTRSFLDPKNMNWEVALLEAMDHLLDALMEHCDDCNTILKSFFPDAKSKECKKALEKFKDGIMPYRDHIGRLVNFIKHNQGCLRIIVFYWEFEVVFGYFVEGPIKGGGLGPSPEIHPTSNTAFSFNYDLSYHLCGVYAISDSLSQIMKMIDNRLAPPVPNEISDDTDSEWRNMVELVSRFPHRYFPDELNKPIPLVSLTPLKFRVEYPSKRAMPKTVPNRAQITTKFMGDGVTRTFKLPYKGQLG